MSVPPLTPADVVSPSLSAKGGGPAYELKFLLDEARAAEVQTCAQRRLALDPHGDPSLGGAYRTTSLYFDTPQLDVYHRSQSYRRRKFRIRRYGSAACLFLERKSKWGDRVEKRRSFVPHDEVGLLAHPMSLVTWPGHWFHLRLLMRRLNPACQIVYQRIAFVGSCPESPLRLTFDRHVHGVLTSDWNLAPVEGGLPLLGGQVIMELKFRAALPAPFKELVKEFQLNPRSVSKYRLCREAWGASRAAPEPRESARA